MHLEFGCFIYLISVSNPPETDHQHLKKHQWQTWNWGSAKLIFERLLSWGRTVEKRSETAALLEQQDFPYQVSINNISRRRISVSSCSSDNVSQSLSVSFCTLDYTILLTSSTGKEGNQRSSSTIYWALLCHVFFLQSKRHFTHTEKTQEYGEFQML